MTKKWYRDSSDTTFFEGRTSPKSRCDKDLPVKTRLLEVRPSKGIPIDY